MGHTGSYLRSWRITPEVVARYGTSPISGPHDKQCGYNQGRIQINSGYRCATASQRVISTWSSVNGLMNGGSHPLPRKYQKEQQKERQSRGETQPPEIPSAQETKEWAKTSRLRTDEGSKKIGTQKGKKETTQPTKGTTETS
jgi:hypothetical protein